MFCSKCGGDVTGAKFCARCGAAVVVAPVEPTVVVNPAPGGGGGAGGGLWSQPAPGFAQYAPPVAGYRPAFVSFGQAIQAGFKGYVIWNARSTRAEYWWWSLFVFLVTLGALLIDAIVTGGVLYIVSIVGLFLPNLSVLVRRLHDTNRNGGWVWILLVPIGGPIVILVFTLLESVPGPTRWNRSLVSEL